MRKIMVLALCGLFCGWSAEKACAADDVYVDLSVLNEIGGGSAPSVYGRPEPLFPVIRNTPQFPVVKKSAPKAPKAKTPVRKNKQKLKIKQVKVVEKEEKIAIPAKPADIQPAREKANSAVENKLAVVEPAKDMPVGDKTVKNEVKEKAAVPAVELTSAPAKREFVADVPAAGQAPFKTEEPVPAEKVSSAPVVPVKAESVENQPVGEVPAGAEKKAEPLVPVSGALVAKPVADAEKVKREIVFTEGSSELDDLSKEKIDAIIASFDNAGANKIAIMAYNYDNGQDVFRKKRQSLNRAIEIRSYLLAKGYKNFSIKVINITDDAARGNVVEIDEIK
mgnify:FL=1